MKSPLRIGGFERRLVVFFLLLSLPPTLLIAFVSTRYFMQSIRLVSNPAVEQSFTNSMEIARDFSAKLEEDSRCAVLRLRDEFQRAGRPAPGPALEDILVRVSVETHADFTAVYLAEGDSWMLRQSHPAAFARIDTKVLLSGSDLLRPGSPEALSVEASPQETSPEDTSHENTSPEETSPQRTSGDERLPGQAPSASSASSASSVRSASSAPSGPSGAAASDEGFSHPAFSDADIVASGIESEGTLFVAGYALERGFAEKMRRTGDDLGRYRAVGFYVSVMRRYIIIATSVLVVLVAVGSALLSRVLAKRISQPITELAHATERVARGDLDYRVTVAARDEVASLVAGFNKMTEELQENKRNLIRAERIAAWRDVARRIAHEIKNPLTPIEIAIYRIKKRLEARAEPDRAGDDRRVIEESLDSILKEVTALKTIAQEFSSFAKLPEPKPESLDINETVKSVLELYASSSQQVEIKIRLTPRLPLIRADRDQMRSVVANLVKNAFEAMPSGGTLTVATAVAKDTPAGPSHVRVEISDTGAGIPEEIRDKIFDPYFTTKPSGTGVGLALAYRILADHRAKISFRTGPGGTSFLVDLPAEAQF